MPTKLIVLTEAPMELAQAFHKTSVIREIYRDEILNSPSMIQHVQF